MKAFIIALVTVVLTVGSSLTLTFVGTARLSSYLEALPDETVLSREAEEALAALSERVLGELTLLNSLFPHGRVDDLNNALRRATESAKARDDAEYRILCGELTSILRDMRRDLTLCFSDFV